PRPHRPRPRRPPRRPRRAPRPTSERHPEGTPMDVVEYRGWKNNLRLSNGDAELIVTLDVGPRVISYRLPGGPNVMKNYDAMMGKAGEPEWQIRGGHRFWLAPEDLTRTYFPDNRPVKLESLGTEAARLTPPPEDEHGVQTGMEVPVA